MMNWIKNFVGLDKVKELLKNDEVNNMDEVSALKDQICLLNQEIEQTKAKLLYMSLKYMTMIPIYRKNSIGNGSTYCNVSAWDLLDSACKNIWNVQDVVDKYFYDMGGEISAYNYEIKWALNSFSLSQMLQTTAERAYMNCLEALKQEKIKSISCQAAQTYANKGVPVMVISAGITGLSNHVSIVCPDSNNFDSTKGCLIGNVGESNGIMYISDKRAWGDKWKDSKVLYVLFPELI